MCVHVCVLKFSLILLRVKSQKANNSNKNNRMCVDYVYAPIFSSSIWYSKSGCFCCCCCCWTPAIVQHFNWLGSNNQSSQWTETGIRFVRTAFFRAFFETFEPCEFFDLIFIDVICFFSLADQQLQWYMLRLLGVALFTHFGHLLRVRNRVRTCTHSIGFFSLSLSSFTQP